MILHELSSLGIKSELPTKLFQQNETTPFQEIGIGKPLLIRFHSVYLGNLKKGLFNSKKDIIVCSHIKDDTTYNVAPKAVHQIYRKKDQREILYPSADNEGTALIYYSKAFDKDLLRITIELKSDKFPERAFNDISNALSVAGGIPIFSGFSSFLIAGGQILKSASGLLNKAIEGNPFLKFNTKIVDGIGGFKNTKPGFRVATNSNQASEFNGYTIEEVNEASNDFVLKKDGKIYDGGVPYMILSFDGNEVSAYEDFTPTLASAAILKKFYGINENSSIDEMKTMIEAYSDFTYIEKIKKSEKELINADDERKGELNELIQAYKKNITNLEIYKLDK